MPTKNIDDLFARREPRDDATSRPINQTPGPQPNQMLRQEDGAIIEEIKNRTTNFVGSVVGAESLNIPALPKDRPVISKMGVEGKKLPANLWPNNIGLGMPAVSVFQNNHVKLHFHAYKEWEKKILHTRAADTRQMPKRPGLNAYDPVFAEVRAEQGHVRLGVERLNLHPPCPSRRAERRNRYGSKARVLQGSQMDRVCSQCRQVEPP
jgi:DNA-directed RNA polymerase subunit H (RpoH/RPB5)